MKFLRHLCSLAALGMPFYTTAQIPTPPQQAAALQNKLSSLILPNVTFQDATLDEAVENLRIKCREADQKIHPFASGINFVLLTSSEKNLNLQLRAVPAAEAVRFITELTGVSYIVEPHAVVIVPKGFQMRNPPSKLIAVRGQEAVWQRVIKPTVQFQKATIEEACGYLSESIRHACDFSGERPAFNIVLKSTSEASARLLDLDLKNIPISEALRYIAELAGLKLRFHAHAVVFSPEDDALDAPILIESKGRAKVLADKLVIPQVEFQNATLRDAIDFVRIKSCELDPDKKGIQITTQPGVELTRTIDLSLKSMPASELLRYCAVLTGHRLSVDDRAFNMRPK